MSGPNTPRSDGLGQQPKQMSSRLLTMKFMQRATSANRTPSQPTTPTSEPPVKRRRTEESPLSSGPPTPATESKIFADRSDIRAALKAESALETLASRRAAANNAFETQWVLDVHIPMQNGNGMQGVGDEVEGEASDEDGDWGETTGRQTYGSFRRRKRASTGTASKTNTPKYRMDNADLEPGDEDEDDSEKPSEGELSEEEEEDEEEGFAGTLSTAQQKKRKAAAMDYTNERALAALDKVDLAKSSYAKSKGAFLPTRNHGHKGGQERHGTYVGGKFRNKNKVQKNTKSRKK